jgi:hypothetical protein
MLGVAAAVAFVAFALALGTFQAWQPHAHAPGDWYPQGSPLHWPCHTLPWAAAAATVAPAAPLTLWAFRRARWSRPPSLLEELTLATVVSAGAWLPALFALMWVLMETFRCTYI